MICQSSAGLGVAHDAPVCFSLPCFALRGATPSCGVAAASASQFVGLRSLLANVEALNFEALRSKRKFAKATAAMTQPLAISRVY